MKFTSYKNIQERPLTSLSLHVCSYLGLRIPDVKHKGWYEKNLGAQRNKAVYSTNNLALPSDLSFVGASQGSELPVLTNSITIIGLRIQRLNHKGSSMSLYTLSLWDTREASVRFPKRTSKTAQNLSKTIHSLIKHHQENLQKIYLTFQSQAIKLGLGLTIPDVKHKGQYAKDLGAQRNKAVYSTNNLALPSDLSFVGTSQSCELPVPINSITVIGLTIQRLNHKGGSMSWCTAPIWMLLRRSVMTTKIRYKDNCKPEKQIAKTDCVYPKIHTTTKNFSFYDTSPMFIKRNYSSETISKTYTIAA